LAALFINLSELVLRPRERLIFPHKSGNKVNIPNTKIIPPDIYFQKSGCIFISSVEDLSIKVNTNIDTEREVIIVNGFFQLLPVSEPPKITGSSVKTQGARIVNTPAINEMNKYSILLN